jgi:hypothetical protein
MADPILELVEGSDPGRNFSLRGEQVAGRDTSQAIALTDEQVSRRHARFTIAGNEVTVEDLGSRNGTYVNGQVLTGPRRLVPGDRVRMGLSVLLLRTPSQVAAQPSAVIPSPEITDVPEGVLKPATESELAPGPPPIQSDPERGAPGLRAAEVEPAFIPAAVRHGEESERDEYDELAKLVDGRVKRQTNVAAFALLAASALAVIIYLGVTG